MHSLRESFETVTRRRKTLEIHTDEESVATELRHQFDTRNVDVTHQPLGSIDETGFVIIRTDDGEFQGALGIDQFEAILSPDIHPPWELDEPDHDHAELFRFLENTLFSSYSRRQMIATSREIEERAWRVGRGRLYAGFQRAGALRAQADIYERFGTHESITVAVFLDEQRDVAFPDPVTVITDADSELGAFWFVVFDGGGSDLHQCALVAEERDPGQYYGFWTFEPTIVSELFAYLERTYAVSEPESDDTTR
ncbi:DICT sensory domain-containing protein [Natrinema ejinorense]|uniref:Histidine kinase n=1 Tax=Natrinema ejinorense TaxID=373386 RepID=A0A2A5QTJ4_9EURY|nr:DICT sensory domain-containing protein [Natrinema ejinorense]PCR90158.1 histidine kinase [Natrinema ejinorense]